MVFANGYLYNYGNFRNIFVSPSVDGSITAGVHTLVFYTATQIYAESDDRRLKVRFEIFK